VEDGSIIRSFRLFRLFFLLLFDFGII
jgi:hypothetical protein